MSMATRNDEGNDSPQRAAVNEQQRTDAPTCLRGTAAAQPQLQHHRRETVSSSYGYYYMSYASVVFVAAIMLLIGCHYYFFHAAAPVDFCRPDEHRQTQTPLPTPVIVDTDMGEDDLTVLLYFLRLSARPVPSYRDRENTHREKDNLAPSDGSGAPQYYDQPHHPLINLELVTVCGNSWTHLEPAVANAINFFSPPLRDSTKDRMERDVTEERRQRPKGSSPHRQRRGTGSGVERIPVAAGSSLSWANAEGPNEEERRGEGRGESKDKKKQRHLLYQSRIPEHLRVQVDHMYGADVLLPHDDEALDELPRQPTKTTDQRETTPPLANTATEAMRKVLLRYPAGSKAVDLLAIGGATNFATMLRDCVPCRSRVRRVVLMAGAVYVDGNFGNFGTPEAESNAYVDPQALDFLFSVPGVEVVLIPLDATNDVHYTEELWELLTGHSIGVPLPTRHGKSGDRIVEGRDRDNTTTTGSSRAQITSTLLTQWRQFVNRSDDFLQFMYPWDIFAAFYLVHTASAPLEPIGAPTALNHRCSHSEDAPGKNPPPATTLFSTVSLPMAVTLDRDEWKAGRTVPAQSEGLHLLRHQRERKKNVTVVVGVKSGGARAMFESLEYAL